MTRRRSVLDQLQRDLYLAQRAAGDLSALEKGGPPRLARRVLRRRVTRAAYQLARKWK